MKKFIQKQNNITLIYFILSKPLLHKDIRKIYLTHIKLDKGTILLLVNQQYYTIVQPIDFKKSLLLSSFKDLLINSIGKIMKQYNQEATHYTIIYKFSEQA